MSRFAAAHFPEVMKTISRGCFLSIGLVLLSVRADLAAVAIEPQTRASVSSRLDEALKTSDAGLAKALMLEDIGTADDLFLSYLDQDIEGSPENREAGPAMLAKRLADLYYDLFELDLERGVVSYWETAPSLQRQAVLSVLRDHFAVYKEERALDNSPLMPVGWQDCFVAKFSGIGRAHV